MRRVRPALFPSPSSFTIIKRCSFQIGLRGALRTERGLKVILLALRMREEQEDKEECFLEKRPGVKSFRSFEDSFRAPAYFSSKGAKVTFSMYSFTARLPSIPSVRLVSKA